MKNAANIIHHCTSFREGDWVVFRCPQCEGYERRFHLVTLEMKVKGQNEHLHTGTNTGGENMAALAQVVDTN